jgi:hypothetical protein
MKTVLGKKGKMTVDNPDTQTGDLHLGVANSWEWQLVVAAGEIALGPVPVLIDNTGITHYSPIKLMRESDYGA